MEVVIIQWEKEIVASLHFGKSHFEGFVALSIYVYQHNTSNEPKLQPVEVII